MSEQAEKQPFWEIANLPAPGIRLSLEDYLALPETMIPMELIDGVVVYPHWNEENMSPIPRPTHQLIVLETAILLHRLIPNGQVVIAPMDVVIGEKTVQPDVFWVSADGDCKVTDTHFTGAPDLVVEVLSPGNVAHDRVTKFNLYEAEGVREYWIVDPDEDYVEAFSREVGRFKRLGAYRPDQTFDSPVLDKAIPVKAIFDI